MTRPDAGRRFARAAARLERWRGEADRAVEKFEAAVARGAAPRWVAYWAKQAMRADRLAQRAEADRDAWAHTVTTELHRRRRDVLRKREQRRGKLTPDEREEATRLQREAQRRHPKKVTGKAIELTVKYRTRRKGSDVDFSIRLGRADGARLTLDEGRAALEQWVRRGELPDGYVVDGVNWLRPGHGGLRYGDEDDAMSFHGLVRSMGLGAMAQAVHFPHSGDIKVALVEEDAE